MPEANIVLLNLEGKSPGELEVMRRELITKMQREFKGYDDPDIPTEMLQQLAVITSQLRRKNAGPPKPEKAARASKSKATIDDLLL